MTSMTLAAHDDYLITLHRAKGAAKGPLVITFGGQPSGIAPSGFATGWCLDHHGWDTVYVAQRHGSQYQGLTHDAFISAVSGITEGQDVVCYGSSLGGYAALYFGGAIDARIVAAAPLLPAWPALDRKHDAIPLQHAALIDSPRSSKSPIVVFDPLVPHDKLMIEQMVRPAYPAIRTVEIEDAGHTILDTLKASGLVNGFVTAAILEDQILPVSLDGTSNPLWHFWRGKRLMKSDPARARHHLEQSFDLRPSRHVIGNLLSLLLRQQDLRAAQSLIDAVKASNEPGAVIPPGNADRARAAGLRV